MPAAHMQAGTPAQKAQARSISCGTLSSAAPKMLIKKSASHSDRADATEGRNRSSPTHSPSFPAPVSYTLRCAPPFQSPSPST